MPVRARLPSASIRCQNLRLIMDRVERDTQKDQVLAHALLEARLYVTKVVGETETVIRKRTMCVDEIHQHGLARKTGQIDAVAILVKQNNARYLLTDLQQLPRLGVGWIQILDNLQPAGS